jgi:hypothetical protein
MQRRRYWLQSAGTGAVIILALSWASPAWAPQCPSCKTTSLFLSLSGLFFYPPGPIVPSGENVLLTGEVHVVTHVEAVVAGKFLTDIHLNMAGVTGGGQTTGNMYVGTGSSKLLNVVYPAGPVFPAGPIRATFSLEPTNRGANVPLPLDFALIFGTDGTLLAFIDGIGGGM